MKAKRAVKLKQLVPDRRQTNLEQLINTMIIRGDLENAMKLSREYLDQLGTTIEYEKLCVIANTFCLGKDLKTAFELCMQALRMEPNKPSAAEILFWIYHNKGDLQAFTVIDRLIAAGSIDRRTTYLYWKSLACNNHAKSTLTIESIEAAGGLPDPDFDKYHEVIFSYVMALCDLGETEKARGFLDQIPEHIQGQKHYIPMAYAQIEKMCGNYEQVISLYRDILLRFGEIPEARWNKALAHLAIGELEEGWRDHERRWAWGGFPSLNRSFKARRWRGESLSGRTLLIWAEQGIGDQLMFLTLALEIIKQSAAQVIIEVHHKLVPLVATWYPEADVRPIGPQDCTNLPQYGAVTDEIPMGSLPQLMLASVERLYERPIRFMRSDLPIRDLIAKEKVDLNVDVPIIGICWRSVLLTDARVGGYLGWRGVQKICNDIGNRAIFLSLQYSMSREEKDGLGSLENFFIPTPNFFDDLESHGKYVGSCDLVVTAATVTSQLAGIFNRNTLTWGGGGWTFLGQRRNPWYPNHATLAAKDKVSKTSLVFHLVKWTRASLGDQDNDSIKKVGTP